MADKRTRKQSHNEPEDDGLDGFEVIDLDGFEIYDSEDAYEDPEDFRDKEDRAGAHRRRPRYEDGYDGPDTDDDQFGQRKKTGKKSRKHADSDRNHRRDRENRPGGNKKGRRREPSAPGDMDREDLYESREHLSVGRILGRTVAVILLTLLMIVVFLLGVLTILFKGPSDEACRLMTLSCHETSAMKWVPSVFISVDEYNAILNPEEDAPEEEVAEDIFTPLPMVAGAEDSVSSDSVSAAADESLPDLEVVDINGGTFKGKLMIVRDPSRVQIASIDQFGGTGMTLSQFVEKYDAIGCTNAGGFEDENGKGKGGIPDGLVIRNGEIVYGSAGTSYVDVVGFDADHVLHVGNMTGQAALDAGIVNGTSFSTGPVLIKDGERQTGFVSGINPRTCIGQTADGTVLLIAVEGRMADSLGATFEDMTDILEEYGAINAGNFDGGSSSGMYYEGERITRSCSVIGDRPLPTAVVVSR